MELQSLDATTQKLNSRFRANPNTELKAIFKEIRAEARTSFFGDFVLMAEIVREAHKVKPVTWKRISTMLQISDYYKNLSRGDKAKYYNILYHTAIGELPPPQVVRSSKIAVSNHAKPSEIHTQPLHA